jgi:NAD(P)H dehydrogenase (quinone)
MIVVTGATGKFGRLVIAGLLKHVPAHKIIAAVRTPEKAADLKALGVAIRLADYSKPETLQTAFLGAEKILFISGSEVGQRVPQHKAVVEASQRVGTSLLVYTSILKADSSDLALAEEHKATEQLIQESGLPYVLLRNGWYFENHTGQLAPAIAHGAILGAAGNGRFASAARADYADAAVAVLTSAGHENRAYELGGDHPYTLAELASEVANQSGKPVVYKNLSGTDYESALVGFGLPQGFAHILADADLGAAKGELTTSSQELHTLIARPTTSLAAAVTDALRS